jgi:hypothetical protein
MGRRTMIDEQRAAQWAKPARAAIAKHLDKNEEITRLASIALAALTDLEDLKRYLEQGNANER